MSNSAERSCRSIVLRSRLRSGRRRDALTVLKVLAERLTQLAHSFTWILEFAELALDETLGEIAAAQQGNEKA